MRQQGDIPWVAAPAPAVSLCCGSTSHINIDTQRNTRRDQTRCVLAWISTNLPPRLGEVLFKLFRYRTVDVFVARRVAGDPEMQTDTARITFGLRIFRLWM